MALYGLSCSLTWNQKLVFYQFYWPLFDAKNRLFYAQLYVPLHAYYFVQKKLLTFQLSMRVILLAKISAFKSITRCTPRNGTTSNQQN